jgi:hypothetical protein
MDRLESDYNPNPNSNPIAIETPVYMRMIPKIKNVVGAVWEERTRHPFDDIDYTYLRSGLRINNLLRWFHIMLEPFEANL